MYHAHTFVLSYHNYFFIINYNQTHVSFLREVKKINRKQYFRSESTKEVRHQLRLHNGLFFLYRTPAIARAPERT